LLPDSQIEPVVPKAVVGEHGRNQVIGR